MRSARHQPGALERAQVPRRRAWDVALAIAGDVVAAREELEERDAFEHVGDAGEPGVDLGGLEVMQHVAADDQVEAAIEAQRREIAEPREADVAAAAVA